MRKFVIGMAMASTALASPALAKDDAWYVGLEGGAMIVEDVDFDRDGVANDDVVTLDHEPGYDFGGFVGYDFGAFRAEGTAGVCKLAYAVRIS